MRRGTGHVQVDDAFCLGGGMGLAGLLGSYGVDPYVGVGMVAEQAGQGDAAKSDPAGSKELPAGLGL